MTTDLKAKAQTFLDLHRQPGCFVMPNAWDAGSARLLDLNWSRPPDVRIGFDGKGTASLVDDLEQCAVEAALIGVARLKPTVDDG